VTRSTWAIVGGVLGLVVLALVLAAVMPSRQPAPDLTTPDGTTLAYAVAVQRGDLDQAWDLLATSAKTQVSRDRFITRAEALRGSYERARLSSEDARTEGDTARVDLVRTYPSSGGPFGLGSSSYSNRSTVRLVRENGQWRIATPPDPFVIDKQP
jgi:hypothetical protein